MLFAPWQVNWAAPENQPHKPQLIGTKVYADFPLEDVLDYIDWNPFFQVCVEYPTLIVVPHTARRRSHIAHDSAAAASGGGRYVGLT